MTTTAYAATSRGAPLQPFTFEHRELRNNDVAMEVLYCGVCHSDIHMVNNDWGNSSYPIVPGHEIIGRVTAVGPDVKKYAVGDTVAVGCMVDSCQECEPCKQDDEQYCREGFTPTYSGVDRVDGKLTHGGYAKQVIAREEFVLRVPKGLDLSRAAPLLCAGITTYSPLRHWNVGPGKRVGVIGLGGLGHMAVKLAVGMGAEVTVISRSENKKADALALGAHKVLISTDEQAMEQAANSFDVIIDTVPSQHDLGPYTPLLDLNGALVLVGQIGSLGDVSSVPLVMGRRQVAGSLIGGIAETQELLDLCGEKNILPDCEIISINDINDAYKRLERGDVHYRFVIDMASLPAE
ncbi:MULTISPECIES: NAD(P)-dependent alcohol dehydrogenase [unclassified Saccharibacter]|uniref:NAD(P)-dependent alcohol dehydrogenase n=1 Tax=unclassified Saccharibacter TaxID=2648722 RepID=UPI00132B7645|nr:MULTISPECIES: NAD(P)-dependent alcohol dehydrogenase [unclassified Saccharibacter]MXV36779.1 alcohol dehydrogenase catalytic domain-containing protein [Saccharibacter sp. EH611]MXV58271.1 alcohol dehydrogenase catalytic domain-containing protein [Saccharibacter sp. EH70]MXV65727.1 alcohol dehydrogenase catalytic domain-containing protein [Saccharibacter sp. EH60]